jgi:hypothetical protein
VKSAVLLLLALAVTVGVLAGGPDRAEAKTACGRFTAKNGSFRLEVRVYRIRGSVSCRRARSLSRHVIGARCEGEKLIDGFRCYHGASALHEPRASGFTLRKRHTVIEGRVRAA